MWLEYLLSRGLYRNRVTIVTATEQVSKIEIRGELAQLARASALHAEGQRFESVILHSATIKLQRSLTIWKEKLE